MNKTMTKLIEKRKREYEEIMERAWTSYEMDKNRVDESMVRVIKKVKAMDIKSE
jgi:hypothetical protein